MNLSANHIALLEQPADKQRVTSGTIPDGCDDLEAAGYVTTTGKLIGHSDCDYRCWEIGSR
jgi:hypothetical protein